MQLLKITSIPIEYKISVERPRLEVKAAETPQMDVTRTQPEFHVRTQPAQLRLDTTEARASIGLKSAPRLIQDAAQKGLQDAGKAAAEYARMGNQMAQIQSGMDVADLVSQKLLAQPTTQTVFLPSSGPAISWQPNSIEMNYKSGDTSIDWQIMKNTMDYVPGKFKMDILQYPKIQIEYLGGPHYVPPSADPNYEEKNV